MSVNTNGAAGPESTAQAVAQPVAPVRKRQLAAELLGRRREREALSLVSASSSVAATSASSVASSTASTAASTATPLQAQPPGQAATQSDYDPLRLYRQQYEHYVKTYGQGGGMQGGAASALVPTAGSTSLTTTAGSAMPKVESAAATVVPSSGQTDVPPSPMPSSSSTSTATTTLSPTTATTPTTAVTTTASRVIYMGNLPSDATLSHVLGVVRGGMVESARLVKEKHCAFVA